MEESKREYGVVIGEEFFATEDMNTAVAITRALTNGQAKAAMEGVPTSTQDVRVGMRHKGVIYRMWEREGNEENTAGQEDNNEDR